MERPQSIGRYEIYDKIASGGMASVHFARLRADAGFSRTVAIKRLHRHLLEEQPEFLTAMVDEARLAARINHPNVVPTLDVVTVDGELLVVMEYVRGESLSRLLASAVANNERVPLPVASAILVGALHGLHAAHEAKSDLGEPLGLVHRDVSPQNILVGVDGHARVIDFGVAKAAGRLQTTSDGVVKGKIAYMAPEQLNGRGVSRRSDIYAMGVVLWEVLAGRRLFETTDEYSLLGAKLAGVRDAPGKFVHGLPEGLDALVMRALHVDPDGRFASAREMADALTATVPPAFPPQVAAWVERTAHDALARRAEELEKVERGRPAGLDVPTASAPKPAPSEPQLATMRISSVSLEAKPEPVRAASPSRRTWITGLLVAALAVVAVARLPEFSRVGPAVGSSTDVARAHAPSPVDPLPSATSVPPLTAASAARPAVDPGTAPLEARAPTAPDVVSTPLAPRAALSRARPVSSGRAPASPRSAPPPRPRVDPLAP